MPCWDLIESFFFLLPRPCCGLDNKFEKLAATWQGCADRLCSASAGPCCVFHTSATMRSLIVWSLLLLNIDRVASAPKGVTAGLKATWNMTPFLLETRYSSADACCTARTARGGLGDTQRAPQPSMDMPRKPLKVIDRTVLNTV